MLAEASMDHAREFGSLLVVARSKSGKKVEEIAKEMGVSKRTVRTWESGNQLAPEKRISAISASYTADEGKLREVYLLAKEERNFGHDYKISHRDTSKKSVNQVFHATIEPRQERVRLNFDNHTGGKHHR